MRYRFQLLFIWPRLIKSFVDLIVNVPLCSGLWLMKCCCKRDKCTTICISLCRQLQFLRDDVYNTKAFPIVCTLRVGFGTRCSLFMLMRPDSIVVYNVYFKFAPNVTARLYLGAIWYFAYLVNMYCIFQIKKEVHKQVISEYVPLCIFILNLQGDV